FQVRRAVFGELLEEAALGEGGRELRRRDGDVVLALATGLELREQLLVGRVGVLDEVRQPEVLGELRLVVRAEVVRPVEEEELLLQLVARGRRRGDGGLNRRRGRGRRAGRRGCRGRGGRRGPRAARGQDGARSAERGRGREPSPADPRPQHVLLVLPKS